MWRTRCRRRSDAEKICTPRRFAAGFKLVVKDSFLLPSRSWRPTTVDDMRVRARTEDGRRFVWPCARSDPQNDEERGTHAVVIVRPHYSVFSSRLTYPTVYRSGEGQAVPRREHFEAVHLLHLSLSCVSDGVPS